MPDPAAFAHVTAKARPAASHGVEWPTLVLATTIYGGWIALTWSHDRLPLWALPLLGGWLVAWHGSLQHETIHGHPTGAPTLDALIGAPPLALWLPYRVYRRTHLAHHVAPHVTDPFDDPESRYLAPSGSLRGRSWRMVQRAQATLAGRLILGPFATVGAFLAEEAVRAGRDPLGVLRDWAAHLAGVAIVLVWLDLCGFHPGLYLLACVYPGTALSLLRSFAEHRAATRPGHRVAIVERAGPFALLFLHNNLHALHHRAARVAWYKLPAMYRRHRARLIAGNGGLVYSGYGDVARRYLFSPHDRLIHPAYAEVLAR